MSELHAYIIGTLAGGQRRTAVELVTKLGVVPQVLHPELERLSGAGILDTEERNGDVLYRLTPEAASQLEHGRLDADLFAGVR